MSSRSERLGRIGAVALFIVLMGASTLVFPGMTPLAGAPPVQATMSRPIDRAVRLLSQAKRPYDGVTFCEPLKGYVPNVVALSEGAVHVPESPDGRVIVCLKGAIDFSLAVSKAQKTGLSWVREIDGTPLVVFARNEAHFRSAVERAGAPDLGTSVHETSPLLAALRTGRTDVVLEAGVWDIGAHKDDRLLVFGPYLDMAAGAYTLRIRGTFQGSADQCRAAVAAFKPQVAVTSEAGKTTLQSERPLTVTQGQAGACSVVMQTGFDVGPGGAKLVETPFYGAMTAPMEIVGYALEPAAAAQSR